MAIEYNACMSAALGLLRLQQVDTRIGQLEDRLELIRLELESEAELRAARQAAEIAHAEQDSVEKSRLEAEIQAASQRKKLQQAETALYGGTVRNPKELQDLQADVASLRKHLAGLEASELSWMEELEAAEGQTQLARAEFDRVIEIVQQKRAQLVDTQVELQRQVENLRAERQAALAAVASEFLGTYESLRKSRRGIAVAEVSDNSCAACGTVLTAALQQSARHAATLVHCPSCGRILYGG